MIIGAILLLPVGAWLLVARRRAADGSLRRMAAEHLEVAHHDPIDTDDPRIAALGRRLLDEGLAGLSRPERRVIVELIHPHHATRNANDAVERLETFGDRTADQVAGFGGSWKFILLFIAGLVIWVALNIILLSRGGSTFDAYPFVFLNLILSMVAALQAPIILMSQNRQAKRDRISAALDYEVNLKAELEIMALHDKLDGMRIDRLQALVERQAQAIEDMVKRAGLPTDASATP